MDHKAQNAKCAEALASLLHYAKHGMEQAKRMRDYRTLAAMIKAAYSVDNRYAVIVADMDEAGQEKHLRLMGEMLDIAMDGTSLAVSNGDPRIAANLIEETGELAGSYRRATLSCLSICKPLDFWSLQNPIAKPLSCTTRKEEKRNNGKQKHRSNAAQHA